MWTFLDRLVDALARLLDALGMNGTRLRWRWNQRRGRMGEDGGGSVLPRAESRPRHRFCPKCGALVGQSSPTCGVCGAPVGSGRARDVGKALSGIVPGGGSITGLLLLANGFWFLICLMTMIRSGSGGFGSMLFFPGSFTPTLVDFGALFTPRVVALGEWWRAVTAVFLHGGLVHFFFNSYITYQLGPTIEEEYGGARGFVVYVATGVVGFLFTVGWSAMSGPRVSLGASGAILGWMGLLIAYGIKRGGHVGDRIKRGVGQYVLYIFLISLLIPRIDHAAHIGGLASGFVLGLVIPYGPFRTPSESKVWDTLAIAAALLVVACFGWVALTLRTGSGA